MTSSNIAAFAAIILALFSLLFVFLGSRSKSRSSETTTEPRTDLDQRTGYLSFMRSQADWRSFTYVGDPALLRWHLEIRGYPVGDNDANRRTLYVLLKLDVHEETFLNHRNGCLDDDIWVPWQRVLRADFTVPEFIDLWPIAKPFFAQSFVAHVDEHIRNN